METVGKSGGWRWRTGGGLGGGEKERKRAGTQFLGGIAGKTVRQTSIRTKSEMGDEVGGNETLTSSTAWNTASIPNIPPHRESPRSELSPIDNLSEWLHSDFLRFVSN